MLNTCRSSVSPKPVGMFCKASAATSTFHSCIAVAFLTLDHTGQPWSAGVGIGGCREEEYTATIPMCENVCMHLFMHACIAWRPRCYNLQELSCVTHACFRVTHPSPGSNDTLTSQTNSPGFCRLASGP
eukprot:354879-Chlamydomonas_euryale.AAC.7